jgi:hypothetical protein
MSSLLDNNKSYTKLQWAKLNTLTPSVTCELAVVSQAGMDSVISAVLVISVDVEVAGPRPRSEPRDGFLDLKTFL